VIGRLGDAMRDNYTEMKNRMRGQFLQYDQEKMIRKFDLAATEEHIFITFIGREYRVLRKTGDVQWSEDGFLTCHDAGFNEAMTIYDVLCCSKGDCCTTGEYASSVNLPGTGHTGWRTGSGLLYDRHASAFNSAPEALSRACAMLGGVPEGRGDAAFRIPIFPFLPVRFSFWLSDEDFPPEIKVLWDTGALSFLHFETLWYAEGHLLTRLNELMKGEV